MSAGLRSAARTDVGRQRESNEDSMLASAPLFVVADGLGGHKGGEVASALAIETVRAVAELDPADAVDAIGDAVLRANRAIYDQARTDANLTGMGTTLTAVVIDGANAHLVHVGDSRAYLVREGAIEQLTEDHTMVARMVRDGRLTPEEADRHPQRSMLTRALGSEPDVRLDDADIPLAPGDRLLLCSDGLTNMLSDGEIAQIVRDGGAPDTVCDMLIDAANARGGVDNITAVLVEMPATLPAAAPRAAAAPAVAAATDRRPGRRALVWSAIVLALVMGGAGGVRLWSNASWYVGETGGEVAVFQGLPMDLPLMRLHRVVQTTGIALTDLPEHLQRSLRDGITAASREDARRIVTEQIAPNAVAPTEGPDEAPPGSPSASPSASASPSGSGTP